LGELADIRRGASPRPIQDEKWFDKNSKIGWLRISDVTEQNGRIHFIEQKLSFAGQEKTLVLNEPHLILSITATIGKPVINYVPTGIHDGFIVFLNLKTDMEFLFQWLEIFRPQWQKLGQSGSQVNINSELVRDQIITLPKSKEEQTQIGNFFKQLDDTIALHQRELEKFKILKTSYLENIFLGKVLLFTAKNTITWEQRKFLDNIESIIDFRGRTPRKLGMEWGESGYLALSALNVKNGCIDPSVDAHFGDEALYQKWMTGNELKQGQVLFTTEAPMGNVAQIPDDKKYILSQRTIAFNIKEKYITDDFLAVLLRSPNVFNDLDSLSSGGTAKGISQKSLSNLYVKVPNSLEEQTQIGNFFKQLDDTIALHQKELAKYQQIKAACLEKMFVE